MPDGVVQWFDPATDEGRIVRAGRRFTVDGASMETACRVPGARVHFDIDHGSSGDIAINVTARSGTRTSRRQRRFGDLTGARRADTKGTAPFAHAHPEDAHDLQRHPLAVARRWAQRMTDADLDGAMLSYAPDAAVHANGDVAVGPGAIRRLWSSSPLLGGSEPSSIHGEDEGTVVLRWEHDPPDGQPVESHLRIAHGEIADQRHGFLWRTFTVGEAPLPIELSAKGSVSDEERSMAVAKIGKVLHQLDLGAERTNIRLARDASPGRPRPARARVVVHLDGRSVSAHAEAADLIEAIDLMELRLRHRLARTANLRRALRRRGPGGSEGEWRHGDQATPRPPFLPRPREERELVRRKAYGPEESTVDEAVFDLESMDAEFFLFTDLATGQDAVVDHGSDGSFRLRYVWGPDEVGTAPEAAAPVEIDLQPVPDLGIRAARELLHQTGEAWLFFRDAESGRGSIVYRRADGHDGLIEPARP